MYRSQRWQSCPAETCEWPRNDDSGHYAGERSYEILSRRCSCVSHDIAWRCSSRLVWQTTGWCCKEQGWTHYTAAQHVWFLLYHSEINLWRTSIRIYDKLKELGCDPQYYPITKQCMSYRRRTGQYVDKGKHPCFDSRIDLRSFKRHRDMVQTYWATQRTYGPKFVLFTLSCNDLFLFEYRLEDSTPKAGTTL